MCRNLFLFFLMILTYSCSDDEVIIKEFPNADERLWPYFENFEKEAAERGIIADINARGIVGTLERIDSDHIAGKCQHPTPEENILIIDLPFFVNTADDRLKEFVIFHELGHCYLGRDHREDSYQNGLCISIMRSGVGECIDNYNQNTRKIYLDELFDPDSF